MTIEQQFLARLQRLEDELAIMKLLASYGPSVDAGNADNAAALGRSTAPMTSRTG